MKYERERIVEILDHHKVSKHEILDMSELSEMHEGKCSSVNCRDDWERPECDCDRDEKIDKLAEFVVRHMQESHGE